MNVRKKAKKAALRDHAEEIALTSLVNDHSTFKTQLLARGNSAKAKIAFLKEQFHARVSGDNPRMYTTLACTLADSKLAMNEYGPLLEDRPEPHRGSSTLCLARVQNSFVPLL